MKKIIVISLGLFVALPPMLFASESTYGLCGYLQSRIAAIPLDGEYEMTIRLCEDGDDGDCPWEEEQDVTIDAGSFCLNIGAEDTLPDPSEELFFVELKLDGDTFDRFEITSVPRAAFADVAETSQGLSDNATLPDNIINSNHITENSITADKLDTTGVIAGSYTNTDITVGADGRISAASNGTAGSSLSTPVSVANGGTGSATAAIARTALGTAASGANSDITSLTGLTTALSVAQGGTAATTAAGARTALGAAASGANSDITSLAFSSTAITTDITLQNGETIDNNTDGEISLGGAILHNFLRKASQKNTTQTYTVSAAESGKVFHTAGATGVVTVDFILPPAATGLIFTFVAAHDNGNATAEVRIDTPTAEADDKFYLSGPPAPVAGDRIRNPVGGDEGITLLAVDSTTWIPVSRLGNGWTIEN